MHRGLTNHEDFVESFVAGCKDQRFGAVSVHDHIEHIRFAFDELHLSCCNVHTAVREVMP